jgi:hypothetical protein
MDTFIALLFDNVVRYCVSGHDHHYYLSLVSAPIMPGKWVHQLITQSDSSKFYTPVPPFSTNDMPVAV